MLEGKKESRWMVLLDLGIMMLFGCLLFGLVGVGRYNSAGMSIRLFLILNTMATLSIFLRCFRVGRSNFLSISVTLAVGLKLPKILRAERRCTISSSSWCVLVDGSQIGEAYSMSGLTSPL